MRDMETFVRNEMQCLSNAVLQAGINQSLFDLPMLLRGVLPLVRKVVQDNAIPVGVVAKVEMHQCPRERGFVQYTLHVRLEDGQCFHQEFQGSGFGATHRSYVLYDRRRDGKVEHLHLVH